jgi:predicted RNase H-like HicB family nuclease
MLNMKKLDEYLKKNYRIEIEPDPDGGWLAMHPDLPGCMGDGETAQAALGCLEICRRLWLECSLANGVEIPEPNALDAGRKAQ